MPRSADHALLGRLAELIPPPDDVPPLDWEEIERRWGTPLPADYRAFRERWDTGALEDTVDVHHERELEDWVRDAVRDLLEDEDDPPPIFPAAGGILVWGSTETHWFLFWRTEGEPEDWRVVLLDETMCWIESGLPFVEWLVAALEGRLERGTVPPEIEPEDEAELPPAGERGHRWFVDAAVEAGDDGETGALDPHGVLQAISAGDYGDGSANAVALDLGGVLGRPRDEALEAFLAWLAGHDPALRDEIADARARASREELELRSAAAVPGVARAAATFAAAELGVPLSDPEFLDFLIDEDWPPGRLGAPRRQREAFGARRAQGARRPPATRGNRLDPQYARPRRRRARIAQRDEEAATGQPPRRREHPAADLGALAVALDEVRRLRAHGDPVGACAARRAITPGIAAEVHDVVARAAGEPVSREPVVARPPLRASRPSPPCTSSSPRRPSVTLPAARSPEPPRSAGPGRRRRAARRRLGSPHARWRSRCRARRPTPRRPASADRRAPAPTGVRLHFAAPVAVTCARGLSGGSGDRAGGARGGRGGDRDGGRAGVLRPLRAVVDPPRSGYSPRTSSATHSMWCVCGNMSTGRTRPRA